MPANPAPAAPDFANLILTPAQAEAVYSAMCALNNVGGRLSCVDIGPLHRSPQVRCNEAGAVIIESGVTVCRREVHDDQSVFAATYGLPQG